VSVLSVLHGDGALRVLLENFGEDRSSDVACSRKGTKEGRRRSRR